MVWNDDDDAELIRPTSAKVHLFANGAEVAAETVTAADGWDFDFTLKPKYMDGTVIDYEITEDRVEGYNTVIDGFSVVNTHVGREQNSTDVIGIVEWDDGNNARGERPGSITVRLRANGEERESKEVKAGEYDFWNFSFNGVPAVDSQGQEITYSIIVDEISGYTSSVESPSGNAFRIMNTLIVDPDDKEPATLAQAPKADNLVYTGDAQPLVAGGSCSGGTLMYALGQDSKSAPSAESYGAEPPTETDADIYYVWYYVKGDPFHTDTEPACVTATIGKRPVNIAVDDASKAQGDADPAFTGAVEGLVVEGDLGEVRYVRTNDDEVPGAYVGVLTAVYNENPNYDVSVTNGDFTITASGYSVSFDANVPANASTTCTGSMEDQSLTVGEKEALSANGYSLPGYDFTGWNTEADGSGTPYADEAEVENLTDAGDTVTLFAQWSPKEYKIVFNPGEIGGGEHVQTARFDQPGTLEAYSDASFGWNSGGKTLHGWAGTGFGSFYGDGAGFINLCGVPRADGSLADRELVAQWIGGGDIVVTVTKDDVPQDGLARHLALVDGSGTKFSVPASYENGKYTFNPSQASSPGIGPAQLPPGDYDLTLEASGYPKATAHITYGAESASSAVFAYYTISLAKDPDYADFHGVSISGGERVAGEANTVIALDGSELSIKTTVAEGYLFAGYTASGVTPAWEGGDSSKAEQSVVVQGAAAIAAHVAPKPRLAITPRPQTFTYNGQTQGEGDTVYGDPAQITEKVSVDGLREGDSLASVVLDGQGKDAGDHDLVASNAVVANAAGDTVTDDYVIVYEPGTLTIEPANVAITVDDASKVVGEDDPAFAGAVAGLVVEGDLGEVKYIRTNQDEAPGTYTGVLDAEYTANQNYEVAVSKGDFTIKPLHAQKGILAFDFGGGTIDGKTSLVIEADVGDIITIPEAPVRDGYTFKYWKGSEYYPGDKYTVEGDHTFTAVWEKKSDGGNADTRGASSNASGKSSATRTGDGLGETIAMLGAMAVFALCLAFFALYRRRRPDEEKQL